MQFVDGYDSTTPLVSIPVNKEFDGVIFYYNDGEEGSTSEEALAAQFPKATLRSLTRTAGIKADFIDIENGASTVVEAWADIHDGTVMGVYVDKNNLEPVAKALDNLHWVLFLADWTNNPDWAKSQFENYPNLYAVQFMNNKAANYDMSVVGIPDPVTVEPTKPEPVVVEDVKGEEVEIAPSEVEPKVYPIVDALYITNGYYLVDAAGSVYKYGEVLDYGDIVRNKIVSHAAVCSIVGDNSGYALVNEDGEVFTFGSFQYKGGK